MKNKVQEAQPSNINALKDILKHLLSTTHIKYFKKLANSMPLRVKNVMQAEGCMIKY